MGHTRWAHLLAALGVLSVLVPDPAGAHRGPAACNANNLALNVSQDKTVVRNGDTITYTLTTANVDSHGQLACDVTGTTITLTFPATDGSPSGQKQTLATSVDYPAGTSLAVLATVPYVVAVNPGVASVVVKAEATGKLHDAPADDTVDIIKTLSTTVTQPHTTLSVTADPVRGRVPLDVTYSYVEKNDSSTDAPISQVTITDDTCAPLRFTGGDANGNDTLDTGEAWTYTCRRTFDQPGSFHSHARGTGTNVADGLAAPLERAEVSVSVTNPHTTLAVSASPASGVAPLTVDYSYTETNDGTEAITDITVTDDTCSPVTLVGGDADADVVLDPGEVWNLSCRRTFDVPGQYTSQIKATGDVVSDGLPHPEELAQAVVAVAAPPPAATPLEVLSTPPTTRGSSGFPVTGFVFGTLVLVALGLIGAGALARRRARGGPEEG